MDSSALVQSLKKDLQRKEEDYEDLKEKFSAAKKQIQQVQKEVCSRSQDVSSAMLFLVLFEICFSQISNFEG